MQRRGVHFRSLSSRDSPRRRLPMRVGLQRVEDRDVGGRLVSGLGRIGVSLSKGDQEKDDNPGHRVGELGQRTVAQNFVQENLEQAINKFSTLIKQIRLCLFLHSFSDAEQKSGSKEKSLEAARIEPKTS